MAQDEFDESKYVMIEEIGVVEGKAAITVAIWKYGDNSPKLKMQRTGKKKDSTTYHKDVGGVTADEAAALWPLLKKGAEALKKLRA